MDKVTVKELRKQAKGLGITNYTRFRKAELSELVQNAGRDTTVLEPKKVHRWSSNHPKNVEEARSGPSTEKSSSRLWITLLQNLPSHRGFCHLWHNRHLPL